MKKMSLHSSQKSYFSVIFMLLRITASSGQDLLNRQASPEWIQTGPLNYLDVLEAIPPEELNNYIFPNLTCELENDLISENLLRVIPSSTNFRWRSILNRNSFRVSRVWSDRTYEILDVETAENSMSACVIWLFFIAVFVISLAIFFFCIIPLGCLMFHICFMIWHLLTNQFIRQRGRSFLISCQKRKRRLEVARTPNRFRLEPHYTLPTFFRKDSDDEYPEELQEYDLKLMRDNGRMQSEIKVTDRFGNYMEQRGLEYDPLTKRFIYKDENRSEDKIETQELKARLKKERIKQAQELLAQESKYILDIPVYRKTAIELNIPFVEDEERSVILNTLRATLPKKKEKPSSLNPISRVMKPAATPKSSKLEIKYKN